MDLPDLFLFRIINTLDSMIGYKDKYYENIGWMSAKLDTIANYIPSRITGVLIVIAALNNFCRLEEFDKNDDEGS